MDVKNLIPYINNPRNNDEAVDHVAASIREFGFRIPVIIDQQNVIVAGHTRVKAAQKLGIETVPVIKIEDLSPAQLKAFRIADNKTAEFSAWDWEKLDVELQELKEMNFDFDFGFDSKNNLDIDNYFEQNENDKEKESKTITCPKCGELIEL